MCCRVKWTGNLTLRFEQHNKALVESTKRRKPFLLIYYEACIDRDNASRREKYLKTYYGKMYLKRRLKSYLTETMIDFNLQGSSSKANKPKKKTIKKGGISYGH